MSPIHMIDLQYMRRTLRIVEDDINYLDSLCATLTTNERARLRKLRGDVFSVRQIIEHEMADRWGSEGLEDNFTGGDEPPKE